MKTKSLNPNEDLQAIREIMERSSKFLSLSGLAGIFGRKRGETPEKL